MKLYFIDLEKVEDGKIYIDFGDGFYKSYNVEDLRDGILLEDDQDYSKIKLKFNNKVVQNVEVHKSINIKDIYSDVIIKDLIYNRADKDHEHDSVYYTESEIDEKLAGKADVDLSNVTGVLPPTKGGTGKTSLKDSANALLNGLDTGASVPSDEDYYVSQYVNGGTTTTTYHRRPVKALWEYIKTKISTVLGLTASQYKGNADSATNDNLGNPISTTYATKAQLNGKSDTTHTHKDKLSLNTFTMVGLGFTKDSTVSTVDFFKALYKKYGQYRGDLTVTYANASRAYISTDGTTTNRIPINGGIMHCFFGNPDTTWSGHLITYTCMENNETYIIEGVRDSTETGWSRNRLERVVRNNEVINALSSKLDKNTSKINVYGTTYDTVTYGDNNPCIEFAETTGGQPLRLTYTSYDTYQSPSSLTLNGEQGGEYFIAPNIKATGKFYGNLEGTSTKASAVDELKHVRYNKKDNGGLACYFLTHDITDFFDLTKYNSTTGSMSTRGFNGIVISYRENSGFNSQSYAQGQLFYTATYRPLEGSLLLSYNNTAYMPYVVKNKTTNNYYLAIRCIGGGRNISFFGRWSNGNTSAGVSSYVGTEILCTNSNGDLPTNYEIVKNFTNDKGTVLTFEPKWYDFDNVTPNLSVATTNTNGLMSSGDKSKLDGIASGANKTVVDTALNSTSTNPVQNKVVNSALSNKVDKVSGKGLSTNDYTTDEKTRLGSLITYTIATANQTLSKTTAGYIKFIYASGANRTVTYPNVNGTSTTITIPNGLVEIFCSTPNGYAPARVSQTYVS